MAALDRTRPGRSRLFRAVLLFFAIILLVSCVILFSLVSRSVREVGAGRVLTLSLAYTSEKQAVIESLVGRFNERDLRLPSGKRVSVVAEAVGPEQMIAAAIDNRFQMISPDSSIWLADIDRQWASAQGADALLVGERTRYMVSPVVIAMWEDIAVSLGYPQRDLGWADLLDAALEGPAFKWSHPSAGTASGLLATLAMFYAGADVTRDLTVDRATADATLDYVRRLERTVTFYGEGELAVMEEVERKGREFLDAFIVQEQLVIQYNLDHDEKLRAIYPLEGTLWEDHPLVLIEHPSRTDEERQAYYLFRDFLLSQEAQQEILRAGYRPTDLSIRLDGPESPIRPANGVDPSQPQTTLQMPSFSVASVVRNAWQYTKRRANIYLVVDVSGSMEGRKLQKVQLALTAFLDQIEMDMERVGLILFADKAGEVVPLRALSDNRAELEAEMIDLVAGGNTALLDAIDLARIKLQDLGDVERINAIVAMTDGRENRSQIDLERLRQRLERSGNSRVPVVVFCIAYGNDADYELMESISSVSGGFARWGDLETIQDLYRTMSTYF